MHRILYLGIDLPAHLETQNVYHYPIIKIVSRDLNASDIKNALAKFSDYTHLIFTSKNGFRELLKALS